MSIVKDSSGIFLLKGDQLVTLWNLGYICGSRLKKAAHLCGEDPCLLSVMIVSRFCNKFRQLEQRKINLREMLDKKWLQNNPHSAFVPQESVDNAIDTYTRRYSHQILGRLKDFLGSRVNGISSDELGDDEILAHLVLYAANVEQCSFVDNFVSGSGAWLRLCRIIRKEKRRAVQEENLAVARDRAMTFLASIFLAQLLSTYRIEPHTALLDFATSLHDAAVSAS